MIRCTLIICGLVLACMPGSAMASLIESDRVIVTQDGDDTAFNEHTEKGRQAILAVREACCVEAPKGFHGRSDEFAFPADADRHLLHETKRLVVDRRTGGFISTTALQDTRFQITDPHRYVDSLITPMVVLNDSQGASCGCKLGDRVFLRNEDTKKTVWAVYGSNSGKGENGTLEISAAAATALGVAMDWQTRQPKTPAQRITAEIYPGTGYGIRFPHGAVPPVLHRLLKH